MLAVMTNGIDPRVYVSAMGDGFSIDEIFLCYLLELKEFDAGTVEF